MSLMHNCVSTANVDPNFNHIQPLTGNTPLGANSGILQCHFKKFIFSYKRAADPSYSYLQMSTSIYVVASVAIVNLLFVY